MDRSGGWKRQGTFADRNAARRRPSAMVARWEVSFIHGELRRKPADLGDGVRRRDAPECGAHRDEQLGAQSDINLHRSGWAAVVAGRQEHFVRLAGLSELRL